MKFVDLIRDIRAKMNALVNVEDEDIWKWSVANHNALQPQYLAAIKEENLVKVATRGSGNFMGDDFSR
jgi:hypothetical protein